MCKITKFILIFILLVIKPIVAKPIFQELTYNFKQIKFEIRFEDKEYKRSDTLKVFYEVKNNSKNSIWVCDHSTFEYNPYIGLGIDSDFNLYLSLGYPCNVEYACPKFHEVKKGGSYFTTFSYACDSIITYYEKHRSGMVGTWYRYAYPLIAQISFFDKDYLTLNNMDYIAKYDKPVGKLYSLEDLFKYTSNVNNISLSGMIVQLYYE